MLLDWRSEESASGKRTRFRCWPNFLISRWLTPLSLVPIQELISSLYTETIRSTMRHHEATGDGGPLGSELLFLGVLGDRGDPRPSLPGSSFCNSRLVRTLLCFLHTCYDQRFEHCNPILEGGGGWWFQIVHDVHLEQAPFWRENKVPLCVQISNFFFGCSGHVFQFFLMGRALHVFNSCVPCFRVAVNIREAMSWIHHEVM